MGKRKRGQLNDSTYEHHPLIPPTELNELVLKGWETIRFGAS